MDITSRLGMPYQNRQIKLPRQRRPYNRQDMAAVDPMAQRHNQMKSLIVTCGDKATNLNRQIADLTNFLLRDYDNLKENFKKQFVGCVSEIPFKAPVYATVFSVINLKKPIIAMEVLGEIQNALISSLTSGKWNEFKCIMRFLAESVTAKAVSWNSIKSLWENIVSVIENESERPARRDFFATTIISSIPFVSSFLRDNAADDLSRFNSFLCDYLQSRVQDENRRKSLNLCKIYDQVSCPYDQMDELQIILSQLKDLENNNWEQSYTIRPYQNFTESLESQMELNFPTVDIPSDQSSSNYPTFGPVFRIFENFMSEIPLNKGFVPNLPPFNSICRFIMSDLIVDTIQIFDCNHKEAANYLLLTRNIFDEGVVEKIPELKDAREDNTITLADSQPKWSFDQLAMELIFANILKLPSSVRKQVYYHVLLFDYIKVCPQTVPKLLGRCIQTCFHMMNSMDVECVRRLGDWFSHHLSNFGYIWTWTNWDFALNDNPNSQRKFFIKTTLEKCIRLAYYDRIKQSLPESFHGFIPTSEPSSNYRYIAASPAISEQFVSFANDLTANMRQKNAPEEIEKMLNEFIQNIGGEGIRQQTNDLLIQAALNLGSKSFSHTLNVLERYLGLLRAYIKTLDDKVLALQSTMEYWQNNIHFLCIVVDKLLYYRIVDPLAILALIFDSSELSNHFNELHVNDMLIITLNKVIGRVKTSQQQLDDARKTDMDTDEPNNTVNEDSIQSLEVNLQNALRERKDFFLALYQKLIKKIAQEVQSHSGHKLTPYNNWTIGIFVQTLRLSAPHLMDFKSTLELALFNEDVPEIVKTFWEGAFV
ncbi:MIF4G like-domain-containing protein [Paraphysoderma sedebokerense]|nr:MIF4G like-domain-containing protein [Paraphysoderma sedebokerense]